METDPTYHTHDEDNRDPETGFAVTLTDNEIGSSALVGFQLQDGESFSD